MHFDDFLAQQMLRSNDDSARRGGTEPSRHSFRGVWSRVRQIAWGKGTRGECPGRPEMQRAPTPKRWGSPWGE